MTLAVQFAMAGEAAPFLETIEAVSLEPSPLGFRVYRTDTVIVGVAGEHPRFGVDAIGSIPAALLAHTLITQHGVTRLINAGTAGGFEARGGAVGDVYLGADVCVFHDRRIPLPGFTAMGHGHFPVESDALLAQQLGLKLGIVSTGDSLDCTPEDLVQLKALGASVKEMEAAGIAWVCERHRVPLMLLKAITDIVDHPTATQTQFLKNYDHAVTVLTHKLVQLVTLLQTPVRRQS